MTIIIIIIRIIIIIIIIIKLKKERSNWKVISFTFQKTIEENGLDKLKRCHKLLVTRVHKKKPFDNKQAFNYFKQFKIWKISRHFVMHAILFLLSYTSHITDNNCGLKIVCSVFSDCETFPTNIVVKYSARYKQGTIAEQS